MFNRLKNMDIEFNIDKSDPDKRAKLFFAIIGWALIIGFVVYMFNL